MSIKEETEKLIQSIIDQKPLDTKVSFDHLMKDRLADMLDVYKSHIAADAFDGKGGEKSDDEPEETPTEEPEEELSDEEIEKMISDLSDDDLEKLIKDIDAEIPDEPEGETEVVDDAGAVDDTTPKEDDEPETKITEGDRLKALSAGWRAYKKTRSDQIFSKAKPSGRITKMSRGSTLHEKFDFSKFKKKGKNKDDKDDDDDNGKSDKKSDCEKKCEAKEKDKD